MEKCILAGLNIIALILGYRYLKKGGGVDYINKRIGKYSPIIVGPVIVIIFYIIIIGVCNKLGKDNKTILSCCNSIVAFIGTYCLGYYIYKREETERVNKDIIECKKLVKSIEITRDKMYNIANFNDKPSVIKYDKSWMEYYLKYEMLFNDKNYELESTIYRYFENVDVMNEFISNGDYEGAKKYYDSERKRGEYCISGYNIDEAVNHINYACFVKREYFECDYKSLFEKEEVKEIINKYREAYYATVENYVYNYLVKNDLHSIDCNIILKEIVDWLISNKYVSTDIKKYEDKRIIARIVFECFKQIRKKSVRLAFIWGELSLKECM